MNFKDIYTLTAKALDPKEQGKIVLSNDAYAICELIEKMVNLKKEAIARRVK